MQELFVLRELAKEYEVKIFPRIPRTYVRLGFDLKKQTLVNIVAIVVISSNFDCILKKLGLYQSGRSRLRSPVRDYF